MEDNPHEDIEFRCPGRLDETEEVQVIRKMEKVTEERQKLCDTLLTYDDNYVTMTRGSAARREGFSDSALVFDCHECGHRTLICPVCGDSDTPGYFRGETTGELIACHNCNMEEAIRQTRGARADGGVRGRDLPGIPSPSAESRYMEPTEPRGER